LKNEAHSAADYSLLASSYAFWEYLLFGPQLQRCRRAHIRELENCSHVLLLGDGDGRFSTQLLETYPEIQITSLDASGAFLQAANKRRKKSGVTEDRIQTLHTNVMHWKGRASTYDACVAQFFFDSFDEEQLRSIVKTISISLKPSGKLLVSDFHIPSHSQLANLRAKVTIRFLYFIFAWLTGLKTRQLADWIPVLEAECFSLRASTFLSQKTLTSQVFHRS